MKFWKVKDYEFAASNGMFSWGFRWVRDCQIRVGTTIQTVTGWVVTECPKGGRSRETGCYPTLKEARRASGAY